VIWGNRMKKGTIIKGVGGLYSVYSDGAVYSCKPRGIFRKTQKKPMIGDNVILEECDETALTAVMDEILERKNSLIRPAVSNVDRIVFVLAAVAPMPDLLLLDKMLAAAEQKGIETVIVINKSDQSREACESIAASYSKATRVIVTSAAEKQGIDAVRSIVSEGISVLAGQSGVGKSSIINCLLESDTMATGGLTRKLERGKHTTRHSEMFEVGKGLVIDSPGFSLFELSDIEAVELQHYYPEILPHIGKCRFMNCTHTGEPDCVVAPLVSSGEVDSGRYGRYCEIYKEIKEKEKNKYR